MAGAKKNKSLYVHFGCHHTFLREVDETLQSVRCHNELQYIVQFCKSFCLLQIAYKDCICAGTMMA